MFTHLKFPKGSSWEVINEKTLELKTAIFLTIDPMGTPVYTMLSPSGESPPETCDGNEYRLAFAKSDASGGECAL
jgi:hypothetical protein